MGIKLEGMSDLLRNLEQAGNRGQEVAEKALNEGAKILQAKMKQMAPRSAGAGKHLAENIIISAIKDGTIEVGPQKDYFYGFFLEFGTSKMSAQPFAQPAFEASKGQIERKMAEVIRDELRL